MKTLFFFRHGETDWNKNGLVQGASDIPLNESGAQQAAELAAILATRSVETILSSDLIRAQQTADAISAKLGIPVTFSAHLRETNYGEAEGMDRKLVREKYAAIMKEIDNPENENRHHLSLPGGESRHQVLERVNNALHNFLAETPFNTIGVSTHGGIMNALLLQHFNKIKSFQNCELLELKYCSKERKFYES